MCLKNYMFQIQVNVFQTLLCVEMFCNLMHCLVPYVTTLYYIVLYSINYKKDILMDYMLQAVLNCTRLYCTEPNFTAYSP